jgi:hypothetical protein
MCRIWESGLLAADPTFCGLDTDRQRQKKTCTCFRHLTKPELQVQSIGKGHSHAASGSQAFWPLPLFDLLQFTFCRSEKGLSDVEGKPSPQLSGSPLQDRWELETLSVQKQAQLSREGSAPPFRQSIGSDPGRGDREYCIHIPCFCMEREQHAPDELCREATRMPSRAHLPWPLRFPAPGLRKRRNKSCFLT